MPKLIDAPTPYIVGGEWQIKTKFLDEQKARIFGKLFTKSSRNAGNLVDAIENLLQSTVTKLLPATTKATSIRN